MANPNLLAATSIVRRRGYTTFGTSPVTLISNPAGSNLVLLVKQLVFENATLGPNDLSSSFVDASPVQTRELCKGSTVTAGASVTVIDPASPIYLEEGDSINAIASGSGFRAFTEWEQIG